MAEFSVINKIKSHPIIQNRPWLPQFIKFSVVGVSGTIIDYGVLNLLVLVFHLNVYFSSAVSFSLAVVNNFFWNKYWTFRVSNLTGRPYYQFFQFLSVSVVGLGLNLLIMYLLIHFFNLWYNWAKAFAIIVVLFWNFIANKFWTFKVKYKPS